MSAIDDLKKVVIDSHLPDEERLTQQLDLLGQLPGQYNQQVFDKLLELAKYDPKAIRVFIDSFLKTIERLNK